MVPPPADDDPHDPLLSDVPAADGEPQEAVAVAAPVENSESVGDDFPLCCICQQNLLGSDEREATLCGHVFHKYCLEQWRVQARKGPLDCPYRCIHPNNVTLRLRLCLN